MWTNTYRKAVTFSFDDGITQDIKLVQMLNQYDLKATFNINTGLSKVKHSFSIQNMRIHRLPLDEMVSLYEGHEVAVHTSTHPHLTDLSDPEVLQEIEQDIKEIERVFRDRPIGMAYPYGSYDDRVVRLLESKGLKYARTVESNHQTFIQSDLLRFKPTCHIHDPKIFDIIYDFIAYQGDEPQILFIWGHSYEGDVHGIWDDIELVLKKVARHPDMYYGTNRDVLLSKTDTK